MLIEVFIFFLLNSFIFVFFLVRVVFFSFRFFYQFRIVSSSIKYLQKIQYDPVYPQKLICFRKRPIQSVSVDLLKLRSVGALH